MCGGAGGGRCGFLNGFLSAAFVSGDISSSVARHPEPGGSNSSSEALKRVATMGDSSLRLLETGRPRRPLTHVGACERVEKRLCVLAFQLSM